MTCHGAHLFSSDVEIEIQKSNWEGGEERFKAGQEMEISEEGGFKWRKPMDGQLWPMNGQSSPQRGYIWSPANQESKPIRAIDPKKQRKVGQPTNQGQVLVPQKPVQSPGG